jgi:hypothetical protein
MFSAVIAGAIVAVGWFITNWLTVRREHRNRKTESRITYLVDVYERLALSSNRQLTEEHARNIEVVIAKIRLQGTPREIELAHAFLDEWAKTPTGRAASWEPRPSAVRAAQQSSAGA